MPLKTFCQQRKQRITERSDDADSGLSVFKTRKAGRILLVFLIIHSDFPTKKSIKIAEIDYLIFRIDF